MISDLDFVLFILTGLYSKFLGMIGFVMLLAPPFLIWIFIMKFLIKLTDNDYLKSCYEKPNNNLLYMITSGIIIFGGIMPVWYKIIGPIFIKLVEG